MELNKNLAWRYATKQFDATKKIATEDLNQLREAIRLSASSWGIQVYKILVVTNPEIRAKLRPVSWGQSQITDASHLFVFCGYNSVGEKDTNWYIEAKAKASGVAVTDLQGYADFMVQKIEEKSEADKKHWTARQTYIALGNLMAACAELKIDSCPMEGFDADAYDEILGLKEKGLTAVVVAAVGYRSEEDSSQHIPKVRKTQEDLFLEI